MGLCGSNPKIAPTPSEPVANNSVTPQAQNDTPQKPTQQSKDEKKRAKGGSAVTDLVKEHDQARLKESGAVGGFGRSNFIATNTKLLDEQYDVHRGKKGDRGNDKENIAALGHGTYGTVFKGTKKNQGKNKGPQTHRAIKTIHKKSLPDLERFAQEIEVMKALDHPNIVKLYETFEDVRNIYLVMELLTGGELFDRIIEATCFTEKIAALIVKQVLSAVFYMHSQCISHRDLKPENFLMSKDIKKPDGSFDFVESPLKIIDFGLSRRFQPGVPMLTKACTPYYVAPEVLEGSYTELCDVWSIGVILYILLCGTPPFYGDTDQMVLKKVKKGKYDFETPQWRDVSEDAKDLISQLLVLDCSKRLTVHQALKHKWIDQQAPHAKELTLSTAAVSNLKSFRAQNKLKKMALTFIAQELNDDKIKDLKEMFLSLDKDGDGTLTVEEVTDGLHAAGWKKIPESLLLSMKEMDTDGSGSIDYTEFLAATMSRKHFFKEELCWAAFRVFDVDGNGKITKDELAQAFSGNQVNTMADAIGLDKTEIEKIIQDVDQDGDGQIDFEEFMVMMRTRVKEDDSVPANGKSPAITAPES